MNRGNMIPANEFCASHKIEVTFINSLQEAGLIEITKISDTEYLYESQLNEIEKIIRLYYEMDINLEGIETVIHLLQKINDMQEEITLLKNRLRLYESI
ncbi:MAG TPA: MerR family transcriptional regulator [Bacteroidales bacterium]|jgi:hypothetical protein|nr:MerR family transcriptional regulator [Bacteroidales bacterium]HBZ22191.1 MerR family transcriptional regulator [Bacteroidales bacterium]